MNTILKYFLAVLFVAISTTVFSQTKQKSRIGFGAIPAVSYDSDLGFQYGAAINLYQYGKSSTYPSYNHSLYLEWSRFSKGSGINRAMYDSEKWIPTVRTTVDITYLTDQLMDFGGFNGYQTIYDQQLSENTRHFYKNERRMFRMKADFQGFFNDSKLGWVAGYAFYGFKMDTVNLQKLNLGPISGGSLFQRYQKYGLIRADDANGGNINYFKMGLKFDTRDQLACPMKGMWTEAIIQTAPTFANHRPHTKFALIHRQYIKLASNTSLAYRIDYQTTIGRNQVPYYAQPLLITSYLNASTFQGLGGQNTLRGIIRNRIIGNSIAFTNLELRHKIVRFNWFKQNFYVGTNLFFDSGLIIDPIEIPQSLTQEQRKELYLIDFEYGKFHSSVGAGLKIGWNENFVISADFGKAFNKQDGNIGIYLGLNYLF